VKRKKELIGFRTTSEVKQLLEKLAETGYRSISQQCEMIIIEWLKEKKYLTSDKKNK